MYLVGGGSFTAIISHGAVFPLAIDEILFFILMTLCITWIYQKLFITIFTNIILCAYDWERKVDFFWSFQKEEKTGNSSPFPKSAALEDERLKNFHQSQCVRCKVRWHCIFYDAVSNTIRRRWEYRGMITEEGVDTVTYFGGNHGSRVWKSLKLKKVYFPRTRTSWDKYMFNGIVFFKF